ncbi:Protein ssh4 [Dissostichus eleginoides]|uniref:Protein ssh4 n=1 Tax=Dissostichus eleginoides TaxID=100907 RepID=A0AAD9CKF2_DISEL|nr:Protein ssh4 [Dissostichus eleginoides]
MIKCWTTGEAFVSERNEEEEEEEEETLLHEESEAVDSVMENQRDQRGEEKRAARKGALLPGRIARCSGVSPVLR